jgi:hypothetical protein
MALGLVVKNIEYLIRLTAQKSPKMMRCEVGAMKQYRRHR